MKRRRLHGRKRQWPAAAGVVYATLCTVTPSLAASADPPEASVPRVEAFSPLGFSKDVRQVSARFSAPMVRLGDADRPSPFRVRCPVSGAGRWLDESTWVYDFAYDVPGAVGCQFTLRRGARTLAGRRLGGERQFAFDTGGPSIRHRLPERYTNADERQVFVLGLDAQAQAASVAAHAACLHDEGRQRATVELVESRERQDIIGGLREHRRHEYNRLVRAVEKHLPATEASAPQGDGQDEEAMRRVVLIRCRTVLTPGPMVLVWGAGIVGAEGRASPTDQNLDFDIRGRFTAEPSCVKVFGRCLPLELGVRFPTWPLPVSIQPFRLVGPDGATQRTPLDEGRSGAPWTVTFPGPFAEDAAYRIELTAPVVDVDGRPLANADEFPLVVRTERLPPGASFFGDLAVFEAGTDLVAPVLVRRAPSDRLAGKRQRLEDDADVLALVRRIAAEVGPTVHLDAQRQRYYEDNAPWNWPSAAESLVDAQAGAQTFELAVDPSVPYALHAIPVERGFNLLELALPRSPRLGGFDHVVAGVLATDMAVHFQRSRESSLVWVTRLADAQPVADARVQVTDPCTGAALWRGNTDDEGIARVSMALPASGDCHPFYDDYLVSARTVDDASFVITGWDRGGHERSHWRAKLTEPATLLHAIFDRSLYMPGQRVAMKLIARKPTSAGLALPDGVPASAELVIEHAGSGTTYTQRIDVDGRGSALASFDLPETAKLGWYDIAMRMHGLEWNANAFRVERFRVGTMLGRIDMPEGPLVNPAAVPVTLSVSYLGGGPAARLPITLRTEIEFWRSILDGERPDPVTVETALQLDEDGTAHFEVDDLPPLGHGAYLVVEMDYLDANGETTTESSWVDLLPAAVELDAEGVVDEASGQRQVRITVRNLDDTPAVGRPVDVAMYSWWSRDETVHVRLPGGFHTTRYGHEPQLIEKCDATTDADGMVVCPVPKGSHERVIVSVRVADAAGNMRTWDDGVELPRPTTDELVLDIVGSGPHLPGEVVQVVAHLPFERATALVTVQREGILDAFAMHVEGPTAVIPVPVRAAYAPNVDVSVLAVRGRTGPAPDLASVDAASWVDAKGAAVLPADADGPRWRLSTTNLSVDGRGHAVDVQVTTEREAYSVRDEVLAHIVVERKDGVSINAGEVAVAVIDEGLLERWSNRSWRLFEAMMRWRAVDVETASMLSALGRPADYAAPRTVRMATTAYVEEMVVTGSYVARQNFDLPTVADGLGDVDLNLQRVADGPTLGAQTDRDGPLVRERFDSLVHWQGRVPLDENGTAEVAFPLNDLLTSFRIAVIATAGADLFGTGETSIRTVQDLVLHAGLPPTVRDGDRLEASFTVRNASDREQRVDVAAALEGHDELMPRQVVLAPGAAQELAWPVTVPDAATELAWRIDASADGARDSLAVRQKVLPLVPAAVQQAVVRQLAAPLELPVQAPAKALPGRGGVRVALRSSIGVGLDAVRAYMARYPYSCIEQQVSVAVVLGDGRIWNAVMENVRHALDDDGLLRYFPRDELVGSSILTAYVLTIADGAGMPIPHDLRWSMLTGLQRDLDGRAEHASRASPAWRIARERGSEWSNELPVQAALARYGALDDVPLAGTHDLALLPTSALLDWIDILDRLAPLHPSRAAATHALRSRLNLQGTTMGFTTEDWDRLWWQMVSTDGNAARFLLFALEEPEWQADVARMMQGLIARQRRGRWDTTVANAWGTVATERFQERFETEDVDGVSIVRLGAREERLAWDPSRQPPTALLPWSAGETLALRHEGRGAPWGFVALEAAIPTRRAVHRGYRLDRTVTPVRRAGRAWQRGDVAQIDLAIDAASDMTWVVVEDSIPPGATILGSGLGGDSAMLGASGRSSGHRWPAFVERSFESYRAYYEHVPKGRLHLQYRVRYNTAGRFNLPPTRVEAMYAPEMHAERPLPAVVIQ